MINVEEEGEVEEEEGEEKGQGLDSNFESGPKISVAHQGHHAPQFFFLFFFCIIHILKYIDQKLANKICIIIRKMQGIQIYYCLFF